MHPSQEALNAEQMEDRLEAFLEPVLSSRRTAAAPAKSLATCSQQWQDFTLRWVEIIARTNAEMAYQFSAQLSPALTHLANPEEVEAWILLAMDHFDRSGLQKGIRIFRDVGLFATDLHRRQDGLALEEVSGVLETFVHGLSGRPLRVSAGELTYTDTETLYLPEVLTQLPDRERNFSLFKAMVTHLWAQTRFGTWRIDPAEYCQPFANAERALRVFHGLETLRLDACIGRELPGIYRDTLYLREALADASLSASWQAFQQQLAHPQAQVEDSLALLAKAYEDPAIAVCCYQGMLCPEPVKKVMAARLQREKAGFRTILAQLQKEHEITPAAEEEEASPETVREAPIWAVQQEEPDGNTFIVELAGQAISPPAELQGLIASIWQDLGEIPDDYLVAAGPGAYDPKAEQSTEKNPDDVWRGTYHEEGAFFYNEWDCERKHYRKNWCVLRERDVHPIYDDFPARTLHRYAGVVTSLRRTFEALRRENRLLKRQPEGEDIDIDALVEAFADASAGHEMSQQVFTKLQRDERNIAVLFMVDMSGSTKGWINDAEREALILLCEALETLGDRYAIYGFSGMTRKRCEVYRIKDFEQGYSAEVRARISGIRPQDYTRMGVAIRHLSGLLNQLEAKTRLLITLSDGKPDDYNSYRGAYGIEDTRQALFEARGSGIHPFCITIDDQARDYLPHMYGNASYVVVDDVRKLPLKVSDIYRALTT